jgi:hypothetical protein
MSGLGFKNTRAFVRSFKEDTRGSMTVFGLFFFLFSGILGAIALDVTSLYAERTHLQVAADQAAHAALFNLAIVGEDVTDAKDAAIRIVSATLPLAKYGVTIEADDIEFGDYNFATRVFSADPDGVGAVRVTTAFTDERLNAASAYLFRLIGFRSFEIFAQSTFATRTDLDCLTEGFVAVGVVDMQNQNYFGAGLCIHSNSHVEIQPNNGFQMNLDGTSGVRVSMPDGIEGVVVPGTSSIEPVEYGEPGYEDYILELEEITNDIPGLTDSLLAYTMSLPVLERVQNLIDLYSGIEPDSDNLILAGDEIQLPSYIDDDLVPSVVAQTTYDNDIIDGNTLDANAVYNIGCTSNGNSGQIGTLTIQNGIDPITGEATVPVERVVIYTDCNVRFAQGTNVENARIITSSTSSSSFTAPSGLSLGGSTLMGDGTYCETDESSAQLITSGGMAFAGNFSSYGSQVIALGDISFAATPNRANDFVGMSMIAGGVIDMASHVNASSACTPDGSGNNINAKYLTMVY